MARRGTLHTVVSDNGTSFTSKRLQDFVLRRSIKWTFILEKSPWWGGFYERMVRIVKESLRKTLGKARLTYEELETLLEIEMAVNLRPLTYLHDEPIEALTTSHLCIGRRLMNTMIFDHTADDDSPTVIQKRFRFINDNLSHYWKRFYSEYLNQLREKHCYVKGKFDASKLVIGDFVLIKDEDNFKGNSWKQGIINELIVSKDGQIRGASLRTYVNGKISMINRQKLVPLEITTNENERNFVKNTTAVNEKKNVKQNCEDEIIVRNNPDFRCNLQVRPRRKAALIGELARRLSSKQI